MIKRLIGIVVALGVIAVIVFACLGRGSYKSMVFGTKTPVRQIAPAPKPVLTPVPPADSTAVADTVR